MKRQEIMQTDVKVRMNSKKKNNLKLVIAYEGTSYRGWQRLGPSDTESIQGILENALADVLNAKVEITGASRTDAGVHAKGQVANFITGNPIDIDKLKYMVNRKLPSSIQVSHIDKVPLSFHSRFMSKGKIYEYLIDNGEKQRVFTRNLSLWIPERLDVKKMQDAAMYLVGIHDFSGFSNSMKDGRSTVRTISSIQISKVEEMITIQVIGDGFLYNMIRIIVATLIEIGKGKREMDSIHTILRIKDRTLAADTISGCGLCLKQVLYLNNQITP